MLDLDLGLDDAGARGALEIVGSRAAHLWEALCRAYRLLGFDHVLEGHEVLRDLVLARIIEPTNKIGSLGVLDETDRRGDGVVSHGAAPPA